MNKVNKFLETVLINIANSLTKLGHHVTVFNNCKRNEKINHIDG